MADMLRFEDLAHYQWLPLPMWVLDADQLRLVWANPAALTAWRATSLQDLQAQVLPETSAALQTRLQAAMAQHALGIVTHEAWMSGIPGAATRTGRGIVLPDGRSAILVASTAPGAGIDAAGLRGIAAMQHTTVRVALHRLADGVALMRNPAAATTFGNLMADSRADDFSAMFVDATLAALLLHQVREGRSFRGEALLATLDGPRWHALGVRPAQDPVSGAPALQFNAGDISELKASQAALEAARDAAETASRAKSSFLANISHEIRTPMNGVLGLTELVLNTALDARQREFLQLAHGSARSLMSIIDDLLDLSKIEAQKLTLDSAPFALRALLQEALAAPALEAQAKGLVLAWQVAPAIAEQRLGDAQRLRQVLLNLVGNAVKFTERGRIDVAVQPGAEADMLDFSVVDSGIGMTSGQLARVFEPFTQADTSITRRYGGTGLGLSIAQRLVLLMGGQLQADSTPASGSRFEFSLPLPPISS